MISIPKPCHEDFNKMSPTEKGAFCQKCQIDTIDFRGMNNEEIFNAIQANQQSTICGQIYPEQIASFNAEFGEVQAVKRSWIKKLSMAASFTFLLAASSCKNEAEDVEEELEIGYRLKFADVKNLDYELPEIEEPEWIPPPPEIEFIEDELIWLEDEWYPRESSFKNADEDSSSIKLDKVVCKGPRNQLSGELIGPRVLGGVVDDTYGNYDANGNKFGFFKRWKNKRQQKKANKGK